jgi:hypothetical protein
MTFASFQTFYTGLWTSSKGPIRLEVRWVRTIQAHPRWQETAVLTDPTQERSGLAPAQWTRIWSCGRERRHHEAASDLRGLQLNLLAYPRIPEEVSCDSDRWRERYSL